MKSTIIFLATVALLAGSAHALPNNKRAPKIIANRYIVTFKPSAQTEGAGDKIAALVDRINKGSSQERPGAVKSKVHDQFDLGTAFKGISATLDKDMLEVVKKDSIVAEIEPDQVVRAYGSQSGAPWGLVRISEHDLALNSPYKYPDTAGAGVTAYIIDTGIDVEHSEFEGRAKWGVTACKKDGCKDEDDNGHGTHVAGTVASKSYGVAKGAQLVAVKVLGGDGSGSNSGVIAGINWAAKDAKGKKAVANMSLGGGKSSALDKAVAAAVRQGLTFVVAAGNESDDACQGSPSGEPSAITVGATDQSDQAADFSNYGSCVDINAPGVAIKSTWMQGKTEVLDGTSMASPHVCGVAALLLAEDKSLTPAKLAKKLTDLATKDKIQGLQSNTVNALLFNGAQ